MPAPIAFPPPSGLAGVPARLRIIGDLPDGFEGQIRAAWPEAELSAAAGPADATLIWDYTIPYRLEPVPRWVHTRAVGIDSELLGYAAKLILTNGRGAKGPAIAEYVTAVILAHEKRLPELIRAADSRQWLMPFSVRELNGKTVGIIGTGDNGRAIARMLRGLDLTVLGVRRCPGHVAEFDEVGQTADLAKILARCDVLVVAAPLTPATTGLIGRDELACLPPGALVVNVGRGAIIDEPALVDSLRSGHLRGAALDVFETEPLPADSPLWQLPNVIISPHCADITADVAVRSLETFLDNVRRARSGQPLRWVVDADAGY